MLHIRTIGGDLSTKNTKTRHAAVTMNPLDVTLLPASFYRTIYNIIKYNCTRVKVGVTRRTGEKLRDLSLLPTVPNASVQCLPTNRLDDHSSILATRRKCSIMALIQTYVCGAHLNASIY